MAKASVSKRRQKGGDETAVCERILESAFEAFTKSGYATASTLEIATRARFEARFGSHMDRTACRCRGLI